ncbi:hypothetical protein HHK36_000602 [Tetracentron sinense]|uniref:Uncharacterized protein n=1 Tax=Tetracentron sinense TaxID=13715 RepID=A0A835DQ56_TETSI|nr:hypothetical protein HHK36_000602 [Tetracentron sinense]
MSILWEKSKTWRWIVGKTRDSKPFFIAFATICGVVPGIIGYGVMQLTSSRNEQLEAQLRKNARPESLYRPGGQHSALWQSFDALKRVLGMGINYGKTSYWHRGRCR